MSGHATDHPTPSGAPTGVRYVLLIDDDPTRIERMKRVLETEAENVTATVHPGQILVLRATARLPLEPQRGDRGGNRGADSLRTPMGGAWPPGEQLPVTKPVAGAQPAPDGGSADQPAPVIVAFDSATAAIAWFERHGAACELISLDQDLAPVGTPAPDRGDGRQFVDWLIAQPLRPKVIIHTARPHAGDDLRRRLHCEGFAVRQVNPHESPRWIEKAWRHNVRELRAAPPPAAQESDG